MPALMCLTLVEQISRCVLHPAVGHTNAIFGVMQSCHPYSSTTRWSPGEGGVCLLCVCVCVPGELLGERQGSHCL